MQVKIKDLCYPCWDDAHYFCEEVEGKVEGDDWVIYCCCGNEISRSKSLKVV